MPLSTYLLTYLLLDTYYRELLLTAASYRLLLELWLAGRRAEAANPNLTPTSYPNHPNHPNTTPKQADERKLRQEEREAKLQRKKKSSGSPKRKPLYLQV